MKRNAFAWAVADFGTGLSIFVRRRAARPVYGCRRRQLSPRALRWGDEDEEPLGSKTSSQVIVHNALKRLLTATIPLPLGKKMQSGYFCAGLVAAATGGSTIFFAFVPYAAIALAMDLTPAWAATAAAFTAVIVDVVKLNFLEVMGLIHPGDPTAFSSAVPIVAFLGIVGITAGSDPDLD
mmetsp:Transcript_8174/g.16486  ORF Transcript_8174/g.16486 Transcript_8174/m.16486 type:complete len:180 (-) Transcript_8174:22-561(-)